MDEMQQQRGLAVIRRIEQRLSKVLPSSMSQATASPMSRQCFMPGLMAA